MNSSKALYMCIALMPLAAVEANEYPHTESMLEKRQQVLMKAEQLKTQALLLEARSGIPDETLIKLQEATEASLRYEESHCNFLKEISIPNKRRSFTKNHAKCINQYHRFIRQQDMQVARSISNDEQHKQLQRGHVDEQNIPEEAIQQKKESAELEYKASILELRNQTPKELATSLNTLENAFEKYKQNLCEIINKLDTQSQAAINRKSHSCEERLYKRHSDRLQRIKKPLKQYIAHQEKKKKELTPEQKANFYEHVLQRAAEDKHRPLPPHIQEHIARKAGQAAKAPKAHTKAGKTLKSKFISSDNDIPTGKFKAFYFDARNPSEAEHTTLTEMVQMNYPFNEGPGFNIDSQYFGGYWIGKKVVQKPTTLTVTASLGHAETRFIVNGDLILHARNDQSTTFTLDKGEHVIEVEYLNHWHTTNFSLNIGEPVVRLRKNQVYPAIRKHLGPETKVLFAAVYESRNSDNRIQLIPNKPLHDYVLFLGSYEAVQWEMPVQTPNPPKAVIIGGYSKGSNFRGTSSTIVYHTDRGVVPRNHKLTPKCHNIAGRMHCEGDSIDSALQSISRMTGKRKVYGVSGTYGADQLTLPERLVDDKLTQEIQSHQNKIEQERKNNARRSLRSFNQ